MNLNHHDLYNEVAMTTESTIQHIDEPAAAVEVAATQTPPKLNKAQQLYALLGNGFIGDMRQIEILNSKRVRPQPTEDEVKTAEANEVSRKVEIASWNARVDQKKAARAQRRAA